MPKKRTLAEAEAVARDRLLAASRKIEGTADAQKCTALMGRVTSLDEALAFFEVDLERWEVASYICNVWEQGAKGEKASTITPLYQVKLTLKPRPAVFETRELLEHVVARAERKAPRRPGRIFRKPPKAGGLVVLNVFDLHLGKFCWGKETGGENYDAKIAARVYGQAFREMVEQIKGFGLPVKRVLIPFGNDFLNANNEEGTTAKGTPQHNDGRQQRTYAKGFDITEEAVDWVAQELGPVDLLAVPGNHDPDEVFRLAHALRIAFRHHPQVQVDDSPGTRKYYRFGKVLIGLDHGDEISAKDLPLQMAAQRPQDWAETAAGCREWLLGHVHHRRAREFDCEAEDGPVMVRWFPSLAPADVWHSKKGFNLSARSAEWLFYGPSDRLEARGSFYPKRRKGANGAG